jgi:hypothetical protein
MTTQHTSRTVTAASLALAAVIAIVIAACGSGTSGGTDLAQAKPPQTQAPPDKAPEPPAAPTSQSPPVNPVGGQKDGPPVTPKPGGPLTPSATTFKVDAEEFFLRPDQFVEYKFRLNTGARMVFNWKATGPVEVDFHTVPDGKPISASETYQRAQASSGSGDYRAPYPGLHGWYWHNTGKKDVKLVLNASGFWTEAWMFSGDPVGDPMPLQDPAPPEN